LQALAVLNSNPYNYASMRLEPELILFGINWLFNDR